MAYLGIALHTCRRDAPVGVPQKGRTPNMASQKYLAKNQVLILSPLMGEGQVMVTKLILNTSA